MKMGWKTTNIFIDILLKQLFKQEKNYKTPVNVVWYFYPQLRYKYRVHIRTSGVVASMIKLYKYFSIFS